MVFKHLMIAAAIAVSASPVAEGYAATATFQDTAMSVHERLHRYRASYLGNTHHHECAAITNGDNTISFRLDFNRADDSEITSSSIREVVVFGRSAAASGVMYLNELIDSFHQQQSDENVVVYTSAACVNIDDVMLYLSLVRPNGTSAHYQIPWVDGRMDVAY